MRRKKRRTHQLEVLVKRANNLLLRAGADRKRLGSIPKEKLLNSCLDYIQEVKTLTGITGKQRRITLEYLWGIYLMLQEYNSPERHDWPSQAKREISWDEIVEELWKKNDQPLPSAEAFSGGLGFRTVNWDADYWMASTKYPSNPLKGYWNPKEAAKIKPVKNYTREEIDRLNYGKDKDTL